MLTQEQIQNYIRTLKVGGKIENPLIELKRQWWDFENEMGISEFIKDTTSLANTPGGNGYIIIGLDERTGEIFNSPFPSHEKYDDPTKLGNLIYRKVQEPFTLEFFELTIDQKIIVVVEIIESHNRPHIIKEHKTPKQTIQNFIPIRKSSGTRPADKFDLDLIYSSRSVNIPAYKLDLYVSKITYLYNQPYDNKKGFCIDASLLNTGQRSNFITAGELTLFNDSTPLTSFELTQIRLRDESFSKWHDLKRDDFLPLEPNVIINTYMGFAVEHNQIEDYNELYKDKFKNCKFQLSITDFKGSTTLSELFQVRKFK